MLFPVGPLPGVLSPIRPADLPIAVFLVVSVLAAVDLATVGPGENALAMHLVVTPFTGECAVISPGVGAETLNVVVTEVALIFGVISPDEEAMVTMLFSRDIRPLIEGAVGPGLQTISMLAIGDPVALVGRAV